MTATDSPRDEVFDLGCWFEEPGVMRRAHRHNDVELNLAPDGPITYLFGGDRIEIPAGHLAVFWGCLPHQLVGPPAGILYGVTVPLPLFLRRGAPQSLVGRILHGPPLIATSLACHCDLYCFLQWNRELKNPSQEQREIALLEIEAKVRRIATQEAASLSDQVQRAKMSLSVDGSFSRASAMAGFIAEHCLEPIAVADITKAANVSTAHGMRIFRDIVGCTILSYLTQCRIAESQRLLITSDVSIAEVAATAGFGSLSQFYACFATACGLSPGAYRRGLRAAGGGDNLV